MNLYLWSLVLTVLGAILVLVSFAFPPLVTAGLLVAGVGIVMAMVSLVGGLEGPPGQRRRRGAH